MMHTLMNLLRHSSGYTLVLMSFFTIFSIGLAKAQGNSPALSPAELQQINNQPLAPAASASKSTSTPENRKPSYQFKDGNGTEVIEYKDANAPTQVEVKTKYTTYEMSPPDSVKPGAQSGEGNLLSVPSISLPF